MLKIENVWKTFNKGTVNEKVALNCLSLHMKPGDHGLLAWRGMRLIRFEMDNGDVIGGMFYAPAGEENDA